jgi:cellulose synthase/poly-beta-1,6-N-acetylglucosamine synthase-like glycosyltransferase
VLLRAFALWHASSGGRATVAPELRAGGNGGYDLPPYTVLVPLFREANVVPDLVDALSALDYPADKLQIVFITERVDRETQLALAAAGLRPHMQVVIVPDGEPRTKPRALNFAFAQATGDYIVVYDAEDMPEADQLRRAICRLRAAPELGCVQARLNVYNSDDTWLARQFAIEYTALFDCLLPALERLRLPVPLGGTSNHFPRQVLEEVGGWDPYNVTEDADLGIRLARGGWRVEVLGSTTWEEAPETFAIWLGQRTRWLKGWMQTYLVHMREPFRLLRELGVRPFIGLQVLMGGLLLSALVHPWFYALAMLDAVYGVLVISGSSITGQLLWWLGLFNLVMGYATGVALGGMAVTRRGRGGLAAHALLMPAYWLLISCAAYRALWQLAAAPFYWEKTEHSARSSKGHEVTSPPDQRTQLRGDGSMSDES